MEPDAVEQGFDILEIVAPSVAGDQRIPGVVGRRGQPRRVAEHGPQGQPGARRADVRDKLPQITAPTLILHREDSAFVGVEHGRYLAEHIAGARYVELPGADTLYWVGDTNPSSPRSRSSSPASAAVSDAERVLTTIVFTDIVGSTQRAAILGDDRWRDLLDNHDSLVRQELARFGGREVNTAGDGFVATFISPSVALDCAEAIVDAVPTLGIEVRVGIHAGEVEVRGDDIAGMAVHIGARVAALAGPSEVLVSSTVREIVTGSRRTFADRGEHDSRACRSLARLRRCADPALRGLPL